MNKIVIQSLSKGQSVCGALLITDVARKQAKNGPYLQMVLTDGISDIVGKIWQFQSQEYPPAGTVVEVSGIVGSFNNKLDLNISKMCTPLLVDGVPTLPDGSAVDVSEFMKHGPNDMDNVVEALFRLVQSISDSDLCRLVQDILCSVQKEELLNVPAAKSVHHDYMGGLLQHTYETASCAVSLVDTMSLVANMNIDRDLVIAGSVLHDIGKCYSYTFQGVAIDMTDVGSLLGHISIGLEMLAKTPNTCNPLTLMKLRHIIAAHHGKLEWGSPAVPMTIEAEIVHLADLCSARCTTMNTALMQSNEGWTDKVFPLGIKLFNK